MLFTRNKVYFLIHLITIEGQFLSLYEIKEAQLTNFKPYLWGFNLFQLKVRIGNFNLQKCF